MRIAKGLKYIEIFFKNAFKIDLAVKHFPGWYIALVVMLALLGLWICATCIFVLCTKDQEMREQKRWKGYLGIVIGISLIIMSVNFLSYNNSDQMNAVQQAEESLSEAVKLSKEWESLKPEARKARVQQLDASKIDADGYKALREEADALPEKDPLREIIDAKLAGAPKGVIDGYARLQNPSTEDTLDLINKLGDELDEKARKNRPRRQGQNEAQEPPKSQQPPETNSAPETGATSIP